MAIDCGINVRDTPSPAEKAGIQNAAGMTRAIFMMSGILRKGVLEKVE